MVTSSIFDLTVNAFSDLVTEVFSGTDESQKTKLREVLGQFARISKNRSKRKSSTVQHILPPDAKRMKLSVCLPPEMVEKILKLLNIKKICQARLICKQWKEIIDQGNLLKKASGKIFELSCFYIQLMTYFVLILGFCLFYFLVGISCIIVAGSIVYHFNCFHFQKIFHVLLFLVVMTGLLGILDRPLKLLKF